MVFFSAQAFQRTQNDRGEVDTDPSEVQAREISETVSSGFGALLDGAKGLVKDSARPDYWEADTDADFCPICRRDFNPEVGRHHCRRCGKVVCDLCSKYGRFPIFREHISKNTFK